MVGVVGGVHYEVVYKVLHSLLLLLMLHLKPLIRITHLLIPEMQLPDLPEQLLLLLFHLHNRLFLLLDLLQVKLDTCFLQFVLVLQVDLLLLNGLVLDVQLLKELSLEGVVLNLGLGDGVLNSACFEAEVYGID